MTIGTPEHQRHVTSGLAERIVIRVTRVGQKTIGLYALHCGTVLGGGDFLALVINTVENIVGWTDIRVAELLWNHFRVGTEVVRLAIVWIREVSFGGAAELLFEDLFLANSLLGVLNGGTDALIAERSGLGARYFHRLHGTIAISQVKAVVAEHWGCYTDWTFYIHFSSSGCNGNCTEDGQLKEGN